MKIAINMKHDHNVDVDFEISFSHLNIIPM